MTQQYKHVSIPLIVDVGKFIGGRFTGGTLLVVDISLDLGLERESLEIYIPCDTKKDFFIGTSITI